MKRTGDALRPSGARYVVWNIGLRGFGVRVGTTGSKTFALKCHVGGGRSGRVRWGVIGQHGVLTSDQACETAHRWAAEVAAGGDPAGEKIERRKAPTVAELMEKYLQDQTYRKDPSCTKVETGPPERGRTTLTIWNLLETDDV